MRKILIGTHNLGKIQEIKDYLQPRHPDAQFLSLQELESSLTVNENGSTFLENAQTKARTYAQATGLPCLADDSGLEVDALGGNPGIHSARYSGAQASDFENIQKLLKELQRVSSTKRTARFVCAMVLCFPEGLEFVGTGSIEGVILDTLRGEKGFGYDPVFFVPDLNQTFAELSSKKKNQISHRAKALEKISIQLGLRTP